MRRRTLPPASRTLAATLLPLAAAVLLAGGPAACGRDTGEAAETAARAAARGETAAAARGPDPVLIRIPRTGGTARAYVYPRLDSAIWSGRATSVDRVLGFDPEGGTLLLVDARGHPVRLDLLLGDVNVASRTRLSALTSDATGDVYGIEPRGTVVRLARAGTWRLTPPVPARAIFPQSDGTILVAGGRAGSTDVWRVRPPDARLRDTLVLALPIAPRTVSAQVGDRVYFATDTGLVGLRGRDLQPVTPIRVEGRIAALAPTPSGDRLYVALAGSRELQIVDRYTERVARRITLPGVPASLRMDPLGRYILVRPVRGDSAWVIAVATDRLVGSIGTRWTDDLPAVAPDGAIALNGGRDVVFVDGETLQSVRTVPGGARDLWYFTFWNGFRPRAAGVDQPVSFGAPGDSAAAADSGAADTAAQVRHAENSAGAADSAAHAASPPAAAAAAPAVPAPPAAVRAAAPPPAAAPGVPLTFTLSFAALLDGERARAMADSIVVNGDRARVAPTQRAGTPVYRVILGPFGTREAAEAAGRASRRPYWVFAGEP